MGPPALGGTLKVHVVHLVCTSIRPGLGHGDWDWEGGRAVRVGGLEVAAVDGV